MESLRKLSVVGILNFGPRKRALIGNQLVKEGDLLLDKIKILEIRDNAVILGLQKGRYALYLKENSVSLQ